jgi:hypothetical protein
LWAAVKLREATRLPLRVVRKKEEYAAELPGWKEAESASAAIAESLSALCSSGAQKPKKARKTPVVKAIPTELATLQPEQPAGKKKPAVSKPARIEPLKSEKGKKKKAEVESLEDEASERGSAASSSDTERGRADKDGGRKRKRSDGRSNSDRKKHRNKHSNKKTAGISARIGAVIATAGMEEGRRRRHRPRPGLISNYRGACCEDFR